MACWWHNIYNDMHVYNIYMCTYDFACHVDALNWATDVNHIRICIYTWIYVYMCVCVFVLHADEPNWCNRYELHVCMHIYIYMNTQIHTFIRVYFCLSTPPYFVRWSNVHGVQSMVYVSISVFCTCVLSVYGAQSMVYVSICVFCICVISVYGAQSMVYVSISVFERLTELTGQRCTV